MPEARSVDEAMTMIPPGWQLGLQDVGDGEERGRWEANLMRGRGDEFKSTGYWFSPSAPEAICLACLAARQIDSGKSLREVIEASRGEGDA